MKILVTGAAGFIGKNLCTELENRQKSGRLKIAELYCYDKDNSKSELATWAQTCDFVFHLAGVNRPQTEAEFFSGNVDFTTELLNLVADSPKPVPILVSSSIHAAQSGSGYADSKKMGEEAVFTYGHNRGAPVYVFRLANVFGKWCRPNYNSVVATFCQKAAGDEALTINDPAVEVPFVYIDDVVEAFIACLVAYQNTAGDAGREGPGEKPAARAANRAFAAAKTTQETLQKAVCPTAETKLAALPEGYLSVQPIYPVTVGRLATLLEEFRASRKNLTLPDFADGFQKKLYSTYLSYLKTDDFSYPLKMNSDQRGSFTEFVRTLGSGQFSVNVAKPGIVKGNHWHHTKNEKFLVVSGRAVIRFRSIFADEVIEYKVSGEHLEVLDIPVGYTHNIENIGDTDLVTLMWANEPFNPERPDTFFEPV